MSGRPRRRASWPCLSRESGRLAWYHHAVPPATAPSMRISVSVPTQRPRGARIESFFGMVPLRRHGFEKGFGSSLLFDCARKAAKVERNLFEALQAGSTHRLSLGLSMRSVSHEFLID